MIKRNIIYTVISIALLANGKLHAGELIAGAGKFGLKEENHNSKELRAEYRFEEKFGYFNPLVGGLITNRSSNYIYGGLSWSLPLTKHIIIGASFAPGIYHQGDGKDLGTKLQLKSQIELWWACDHEYKIGAALSHLSNAGIHSHNPGIESAILMLAFEL